MPGPARRTTASWSSCCRPSRTGAGHKVDGGAFAVTATLSPAVVEEGEKPKGEEPRIVVRREGPADDTAIVLLFVHDSAGLSLSPTPGADSIETVILEAGR